MRVPQRMGLPVNVVRGAPGHGAGWVIPEGGVGHAGCELECHRRKAPGLRPSMVSTASLADQGKCNPIHLTCLCAEARKRQLWAKLPLAQVCTAPMLHPRLRFTWAPQPLPSGSCVSPDLLSSIQAEPSCHPCPGCQCEKEATWR